MSTSTESRGSTLVIVAGAGRSGTSTVAGSLSRLGFVVPGPEVPADESNPRGFYEPQWVVDFHKRIFGEIKVRTNDARPSAVRLAEEASESPELLAELTSWLAPHARHERLVIKDPRTFWMHDLWRRAAANVGIDLVFLTMLRPPAEVAKSRDQHYLAGRDEGLRRAREITNVASWCHGILVTEQATRGDRRAFVSYPELMADWRTSLRQAGETLGISDLDAGDKRHAIDDFIDPKLNRSQVDWSDLSVPREVSDIADGVSAAASKLLADPSDDDAMATLDDLHHRYDHLLQLALDLTLDEFSVERERHREQRTALQTRQRSRVNKLQTRIDRLQARNSRLESDLLAARQSLTNRIVRRLRRQ